MNINDILILLKEISYNCNDYFKKLCLTTEFSIYHISNKIILNNTKQLSPIYTILIAKIFKKGDI